MQTAAILLIEADAGVDDRIRLLHQRRVAEVELDRALVADVAADEGIERHIGHQDVVGAAQIRLPARRVGEPLPGEVLERRGRSDDRHATLCQRLPGVALRVRVFANLGIGEADRAIEREGVGRARLPLDLDAAGADLADIVERQLDRLVGQLHARLRLEILEVGPERRDVQLDAVAEEAALETHFIGVRCFGADRDRRAGGGEAGRDVVALTLIAGRERGVGHDVLGQILAQRDLAGDDAVARRADAFDEAGGVVRRCRRWGHQIEEAARNLFVVETQPRIDMRCLGEIIRRLRKRRIALRTAGRVPACDHRARRAAIEGAVGLAVRIIEAGDIAERPAAFRREAQFLRELARVEAALRDDAVGQADDGADDIVEILDEVEAPVLIAGDRDQVRRAEIERDAAAAIGLQALVEQRAIESGVEIGVAGRDPDQRRGHRRTEDRRTGRHVAEGARRATAFAHRMARDQIDRDARQRREREATAQAVAAVVVEPPTVIDILDEAVAIAVETVDPETDALGQRAGNHRIDAVFVICRRGTRYSTGQARARPLRHDVERTSRRVLAEQRPLRAAQHFDPGDVAEAGKRLRLLQQRDVVDDHRDRRFDRGREGDRADTAQVDRIVGGHRPGRDGQAWRQTGQVVDCLNVTIDQRVGGDRGDGDRHVLQILFALLRGDDDVLERAVIGDCGGRSLLIAGAGKGIGVGGCGRGVGGGDAAFLCQCRMRQCKRRDAAEPEETFAHVILTR